MSLVLDGFRLAHLRCRSEEATIRESKEGGAMTDLKEIVDALLSISEWPWFVAGDEAEDCPPHKDSGLALVDTGRTADWPIARLCEWNTAKFIASSPVWLAQLVIGWVEEKAKPLAKKEYPHTEWNDLPDKIGTVSYAAKEKFVRLALRDLNLTEERFAELKRRTHERQGSR